MGVQITGRRVSKYPPTISLIEKVYISFLFLKQHVIQSRVAAVSHMAHSWWWQVPYVSRSFKWWKRANLLVIHQITVQQASVTHLHGIGEFPISCRSNQLDSWIIFNRKIVLPCWSYCTAQGRLTKVLRFYCMALNITLQWIRPWAVIMRSTGPAADTAANLSVNKRPSVFFCIGNCLLLCCISNTKLLEYAIHRRALHLVMLHICSEVTE